MLKEIETEYKYLVSREQFQEVLSKCSEKYAFLDRKLQANYYYDTDNNELNRSKTTVRIRQIHNNLKLQIKRHKAAEGSMTINDEFTDNIDELPSVMKIPDTQDTISLKGVLITERTIYTFGDNSTICFDVNMYLGVCDYEIEIEICENDKKEVLSVIENLDLKQTPIMSKSSRFFEKWETMKNG